jgi:hypothetical protein
LGLAGRVDIVQVQGAVRFRFSDGPLAGVNGGEIESAWSEAGSESCWIQPSTRNVFAAAIKGDSGGVVAMTVELFGGGFCQV